MSRDDRKVIVIKKKGRGGHEDHGGAWKVAYADFVTAMMAFFLVMWLLGMNQSQKDLIQGYFSNPVGFQQAFSGGANPLSQGSSPADLNLRRAVLMTRAYQKARFEETAEELREAIAEEGAVRIWRQPWRSSSPRKGMRIELMETGEGETFFDNSSANLKPALTTVLGMIAEELGGLPNDVVVEGHTDASQFGSSGLLQLGAVRGPGQLGQAGPGVVRAEWRSGGGGPGIRRPAPQEPRGRLRSQEPENLRPPPLQGRHQAGRIPDLKGNRGGRYGRFPATSSRPRRGSIK